MKQFLSFRVHENIAEPKKKPILVACDEMVNMETVSRIAPCYKDGEKLHNRCILVIPGQPIMIDGSYEEVKKRLDAL